MSEKEQNTLVDHNSSSEYLILRVRMYSVKSGIPFQNIIADMIMDEKKKLQHIVNICGSIQDACIIGTQSERTLLRNMKKYGLQFPYSGQPLKTSKK